MKRLAILALVLGSVSVAAESASAQWYQSRYPSNYSPYGNYAGSPAPMYRSGTYASPTYAGPYGSFYRGSMVPSRAYWRGYASPGYYQPYGRYYSTPYGYGLTYPR